MFFTKKLPYQPSRGLLVFSLALIVLAACAGNAWAELAFGPSQTVSAGRIGGLQLAVDPQGGSTATWEESDEKNQDLIQAAQVDANGMPGPVQTLAKFPPQGNGLPRPRVVVDSLGRATIAWRSYDGEHARVQAAQIDAAGTVGPVYTVSPAGEDGLDPELAVDSEGRVTIVWRLETRDDVESIRLDADGEPEEAQVLAEAVPGLEPAAVAVDPAGQATVAWPSSEGLRTVQIDPNGVAGSIEPIASTGNADGFVEAVADSQGRATLAWRRGGSPSETKSVQLDAEGAPGAVQTLSAPGEKGSLPELAVDSQDRVTAVWETLNSSVRSVRFAEDGAPGVVQTLSEPGLRAGPPHVAAGPGGTTVVTWSHPAVPYAPEEPCTDDTFNPASDVVKVAVLGPEGEAVQIKNASPFGEQALEPQVGMDALGLPTVAWESFDGTYFCDGLAVRIQVSRGGDVEPPPPPPPPSPPPTPQLDPQPPPAQPPDPGLADGTLHLTPGALAKDDHLLLEVECVSTVAACEGQVRLVVGMGDIPRPLRKSIRGLRSRAGRVTVARGHYSFAAGVRSTLKMSLSGFGRALAHKGSGRSLRAIGSGTGVATDVTYIRLRSSPR